MADFTHNWTNWGPNGSVDSYCRVCGKSATDAPRSCTGWPGSENKVWTYETMNS